MTRKGLDRADWVTRPDAPTMSRVTPEVMRILSHVAVWASVLAALGLELSRGWRPVGDNAAIASHAFQTFTSHPPLVGLSSTAGVLGHPVFGPGPLMFWLLAIPVRIDPTHGLLWGAALLAGAALSLAIEAVWSIRLWPGCAVIAFAVVNMFWLTPAALENISWNAYFPIPFFIATLALAWVVGTGWLGWWPPLVFVASVASQAHLIFSIPGTLLTLAAPFVGIALNGRPRRVRWLWIGFGVATACWIAPLLQQAFGTEGNIAAMFSSQSGQAKLGLRFALSVIGRVGGPTPIWLTHQPTAFLSLVEFEYSPMAGLGVAVLAVVAGVLIWGLVTNRWSLAALAGTGLIGLVGTMVAYAIIPLGILVWAMAGWGVVSVVADIVRLRKGKTLPSSVNTSTQEVWKRWQSPVALTGVVVIAVVFAIGIRQFSGFVPTEATVSWNTSESTAVAAIAHSIEHAVPTGRVEFVVLGGPQSLAAQLAIDQGVGWQLESDGWTPGLESPIGVHAGLVIPAKTVYTAVAVNMAGDRVASVRTARCRTSSLACLAISS
jgi:hypothetical protein